MPASAERMRARALEVERLGDDADGEDALLARGLAMTGAAPVPVPPPMPAAMNTMCAPSSACSTSIASFPRPQRDRLRDASRRQALR
jgi:hypothetical protein